MAKKVIQQRVRLAAIFASFSILIMGTLSLFQTMSLDYYSVLGTLIKVLPASIIIGGLGWVMGMILDQPRRRSRMNYGNLFSHESKGSTKNLDKITAPAEKEGN